MKFNRIIKYVAPPFWGTYGACLTLVLLVYPDTENWKCIIFSLFVAFGSSLGTYIHKVKWNNNNKQNKQI